MGTTPSTSNISNTLFSIINQLDLIYFQGSNIDKNLDGRNMNINLKEKLQKIQKDFVDERIIIFLDSIDQLNPNDFNLEWILKDYPTNTTIIYSTLTHYGGIIETLISKGINEHKSIEKINAKEAIKIFNFSMDAINRLVNEEQRKAVETLFNKLFNDSDKLYPLFVKLIFDIAKNWCSFTIISEEFKTCTDINKTIEYIFKQLEEDYGKLLVSRCLFYFTISSDSGISDNELGQVLSIDDELLEHIFNKQKSPTRTFPLALWNRIKFNLDEYLTCKHVDDKQAYFWLASLSFSF